jgi:hypothetical protein
MNYCQQDTVYAAERKVEQGAWFRDFNHGESWINKVRDTQWFRDNFPNVRYVQVQQKVQGTRSSAGFHPEIAEIICNIRPNQLYERMLCHEVSHGLVEARYDNGAHSPWFARIYLEVVYLMMGSPVYDDLKYAFDRRGVDYDPGREVDHAVRGSIAL